MPCTTRAMRVVDGGAAWKAFLDALRQVLERGAERDEGAAAAMSEVEEQQLAQVVAKILEVLEHRPRWGS